MSSRQVSLSATACSTILLIRIIAACAAERAWAAAVI